MKNPFTWLERQALFVPEKSLRGTPEHVGLEYNAVFPVTADDVKLHGWHIPGNSNAVWLIFHGSGGNISVRLDQYQEIHRRYSASILAIDYRGYGRSEGSPSEAGFYADARAAFDMARELHPSKKIVVFGRSMGRAVAAQLTSVVPDKAVAALVLEASISSIPDVMREKAPWTRFTPVRFIMRSKFATARYVTNQSTPLFVIHGDSDRTVSFENAERKFSAASQPKQLEIIPGGDHDELDLVDPQRYHLVLEEFLSRHYAL